TAWCVPGPVSIQAAAPVWRDGAPLIGPMLAADGRLWLADCGRVHPDALNRPLLDEAMAHLVFVRDDDASLMPLPAQISWLSGLARVGLVVIGRSHRPIGELVDFTGCDAVWLVDRHDVSRSAARAAGSPRRPPRAWRSITATVEAIAAWFTVPPQPAPDPEPSLRRSGGPGATQPGPKMAVGRSV
ncbi:MAG: hypothetical protein ACR2QK_01030, partial [Acidimicrobiales bacterium]